MEYLESDDFSLQMERSGGGGGGIVKEKKRKKKKQQQSPDGKYNSKHVRISQEKLAKAQSQNTPDKHSKHGKHKKK